MRNPLELLHDHAHLEKKAAGNALDLMSRWPEPAPPEHWVERMTAIARDEIEHLAIVSRLLARRGGQLRKFHRNSYAAELRRLVRQGAGTLEVMDRLMVSALIEARSCERFALLAEGVRDDELRKLYAGLWRSERGHFRAFLDLAERLPDTDAHVVQQRWQEMLASEAQLIQTQPPGSRMHSGLNEPRAA